MFIIINKNLTIKSINLIKLLTISFVIAFFSYLVFLISRKDINTLTVSLSVLTSFLAAFLYDYYFSKNNTIFDELILSNLFTKLSENDHLYLNDFAKKLNNRVKFGINILNKKSNSKLKELLFFINVYDTCETKSISINYYRKYLAIYEKIKESEESILKDHNINIDSILVVLYSNYKFTNINSRDEVYLEKENLNLDSRFNLILDFCNKTISDISDIYIQRFIELLPSYEKPENEELILKYDSN
ncbi:MAG: hypothetical protein KAQ75_09245 [Bacteroidales bacterium]|nr:hypothetical protein [Bacteroidales bacterium]